MLADPSPWPTVVDHALVALLTVAVPSLVTIWFGNKKRAESHSDAEAVKEKIAEVHAEVKTGNNLKLGAMADDAESRRIGLIPAANRTAAEDLHIATIPEKR